jgi:hypothetical protein
MSVKMAIRNTSAQAIAHDALYARRYISFNPICGAIVLGSIKA